MARNSKPTWLDYFWLVLLIAISVIVYPDPILMVLPLILLGMWAALLLCWHLGWRKVYGLGSENFTDYLDTSSSRHSVSDDLE